MWRVVKTTEVVDFFRILLDSIVLINYMRRPLKTLAGIFVLTGCFASFAAGQTVVVDMTHPTNHFVPKETLGAGVDRIAADAIDKDLVQPNLDRALEAGWQPVTYRQNTELAGEAWHPNPHSTWSDPPGK